MQVLEESLVAPKEAGQVDGLIQLWSAASWLEQRSHCLGCLCVPCSVTRRSTSYRPFNLCSVSSLILIGSLENSERTGNSSQQMKLEGAEPRNHPGRQLRTQPCAHGTVKERRPCPPSLPGPPQTVPHTRRVHFEFLSPAQMREPLSPWLHCSERE